MCTTNSCLEDVSIPCTCIPPEDIQVVDFCNFVPTGLRVRSSSTRQHARTKNTYHYCCIGSFLSFWQAYISFWQTYIVLARTMTNVSAWTTKRKTHVIYIVFERILHSGGYIWRSWMFLWGNRHHHAERHFLSCCRIDEFQTRKHEWKIWQSQPQFNVILIDLVNVTQQIYLKKVGCTFGNSHNTAFFIYFHKYTNNVWFFES